jgi:ligand-binding sensor domain-containing protein
MKLNCGLRIADFGLLLSLGFTHAGEAQSKWRPEDRVVIADFSKVQAVAASRTTVYAATTEGLIVYDRRFNVWQPPVTRVDGFPDGLVRIGLVDPTDESAWFASDQGLIHYQPQLHQLDNLPTGPVSDLMFDRDDPISGLYIRTSLGWELVPRGGLMGTPATSLPSPGRRIQPASVPAVLQRFPSVEAVAPTSLLDRRLRRFNFTSAAIPTGESEAFFGTDGLGLYRLDGLAGRLEPLAFGLRSSFVGGLVAIPNAVWVGTSERTSPSGFAKISEDLQVTRYDEGGTTAPVFRDIRDMIGRGFQIWAATDRGVFRFEPGNTWNVIDVGDGLPADRVFALAQQPIGVWVGTERGLALVGDTGRANLIGPAGAAVVSLSAVRDTLWVGTTRGLGFTTSSSTEIMIPPDVAAEPVLKGTIMAVVRSADTLVVATPERIVWRGPGGRWTVERVLPELGELRTMASEHGGVWIGGERGLAFFRFKDRAFQTYRVGEDLPGPVTKIVSLGPYIWIGTERGLVRFARRALLP